MLVNFWSVGARRAAARFALVALALCSLSAQPSRAGDIQHDAGGWIMFFGQGSFEPLNLSLARLRWWFDLQPRLTEDSDFNQLLVRPGVGYAFGDASLWLGYAYILDDPANRSSFDEHRIWQQFLYSRSFGSLGAQSRTRLEQRFVETGSDTGWRFREFVKLTHPLGIDRFGIAAYDEVFFDLNDTDWGADAGFTQNRLFVGPSWKPVAIPGLTIELGYLNQYLNREGRADAMNHIASLNFLYSAR